jgi:hypothetical protein
MPSAPDRHEVSATLNSYWYLDTAKNFYTFIGVSARFFLFFFEVFSRWQKRHLQRLSHSGGRNEPGRIQSEGCMGEIAGLLLYSRVNYRRAQFAHAPYPPNSPSTAGPDT